MTFFVNAVLAAISRAGRSRLGSPATTRPGAVFTPASGHGLTQVFAGERPATTILDASFAS
ncbi:MAG: hypothetical protein KKB37_13635 [Alphaproteobacteria bacterium]|nr:hypothetical protein [Alphaproteobacteria bacterium]